MFAPFCFVLMPFGRKQDPRGGPDLDFDALYDRAIRPAIEQAGMEPLRADEESTSGIIHKAMFERLLLSDFAVADLTTMNANVFYELGVRHAARPATTLPIYNKAQRLPFDLNLIRAIPYELEEGNVLSDPLAGTLRTSLTKRLKDLRDLGRDQAPTDSPVFQLLPDYHPPDIAHLQTDTFRQRTQYSESQKARLAELRRLGKPEELRRFEREAGPLDAVDPGVLIDLFLSYRALKDFDAIVDLAGRVPETVRRTRLVRQLVAFAENRRGRREVALRILEDLHRDQPQTSESCSLLGRIYKDLWLNEDKRVEPAKAAGYLDQAIAEYTRGFESDWRDAYPGVNALTLLGVRGTPADLRTSKKLLPVVRYAVEQRFRGREPTYWDHATMLELDVLDGNPDGARNWLSGLLASVREPWEKESTLNNLVLHRDALAARGVGTVWLDQIIDELR